MPRRKTVQQRMRDAIDNQDIVEYSWAVLEQARIELRDKKKLISFTGGDIKNLINIIVAKSLNQRSTSNSDESTLRQLETWLEN